MNRANGKTEKALAKSAGALLIEGLEQGTAHKTKCVWPGSDREFWMVCLSCDELQLVKSAATKRWADLGLEITLYNSDDYYSEEIIQALSRAMRTIDDHTVRLFPDPDELRELVSPDVRSLLASDYIENQQHANPQATDMNPQTIELIREAVKKKDAVALSAFGSSTLAIYLLGTENPPES